MSDWHLLLRRAYERRRATDRRITQEWIGEQVGISRHQVNLYLKGRLPRPQRDVLIKIGEAVQATAEELNEALQRLAYEPIPRGGLAALKDRHVPIDSVAAAVAGYRWPALILNGFFDVVAWNPAAVRVCGVDFAQELPTLRERNLLRIGANPLFKDQVLNWSEVLGYLMSLHKSDVVDLFTPGDSPAYLASVVEDIKQYHPENFDALVALFLNAEPHRHEQRNVYYPRWQPRGDDAVLSFNAMAIGWSDFESTFGNDWMPADADTWDWLNGTEPPAWTPPEPLRHPPAAIPLSERLRELRERAKLTQAQLAERCGIGAQDIYRYEHGLRTPSRERLLRIGHELDLDGATTNLLLTVADYDPEPSTWARFLSGLEVEIEARRWQSGPVPTFTLETLLGEIAPHDWPCMLVGPRCEIAGWNAAAERVFGLESGRPPENLIGFIMRREVRDRFVNWPEVVTNLAPSTLRRSLDLAAIHQPSGLQRLVAELDRTDPELLPELRELWHAAPPAVLTQRVVFEAYWRHPDGTVLAFNTMVSWGANQRYWMVDWHPADGDTWRWLGPPRR